MGHGATLRLATSKTMRLLRAAVHQVALSAGIQVFAGHVITGINSPMDNASVEMASTAHFGEGAPHAIPSA